MYIFHFSLIIACFVSFLCAHKGSCEKLDYVLLFIAAIILLRRVIFAVSLKVIWAHFNSNTTVFISGLFWFAVN